MTCLTKRDAIESAMSIADDVAQDRLTPAALADQAVAELRELFSTVVGEGDPLWDLHRDVARQVLALDGIPADELSEWLAVGRHRAGELVSAPGAEAKPEPEAPVEPDAAPEPVLPELAAPEPGLEVEPQPEPPPPPRRDEYDPLAGWSPGGSRR